MTAKNKKKSDKIEEVKVGKGKRTPMLPALIIKHSKGKLRYGGRKRGAFRIQLSDVKKPASPDEIKDIVKSAGVRVIKIIEPGLAGAASAKFHTYVMRFQKKEFATVFGCGQNRGHSFEDTVKTDLNNSLTAKKQKSDSLFVLLLNALKLKKQDIASITKASGAHIRRPFSTKAENIGPIISDININLKNGQIIYVSLKNVNGFTLANVGYKSSFNAVTGRDNLPYVTNASHPLDHFVLSCGVDKNIAAIGLNDYIRNKPTTNVILNQPVFSYDADVITQYLSSAFGYGYWYIKLNQKTKGGFQIVNIPSKKAAESLVGKVTSVIVSYPCWTENYRSKQITIKIATTTMNCKVEIRSSKGQIVPDEIKIHVNNISSE